MNVVSLIEPSFGRFGRRPALVWDRGAMSGVELGRRVSGTARALRAEGVVAGDRVAISIPNDPRFAIAVLAALTLGATAVPLNPLLAAHERDEILADLKPRMLLEQVPPDEAEWSPPVETGAPAIILYTSGTTGRAKGAMLPHEAVAFAIRSWAEPVMALCDTDVVLAVLPLAHSYGLFGALLAPLLTGATVALLERFTPEAALAAVARHRVTVFPGVATMFKRLLETEALGSVSVATLRIALSGAAPCPWEIAEEWRRRTGIRILRGYGMTELFRPISNLADDPRDVPDSIGRPVPGVEVAIVDDDGRARPAGEVGELWIRTPCAMTGYLDAEAATREVLEHGWFRTGDLATLTDDGFVCIVGRKKELILRGGYSVFPQEVERALGAHPAIAEAAIIGVPHPELGEEVAAVVALRPGATVTADELIAYCRERLAGYKYPRSVSFVDRLPRGSTGKVIKSALGRSGLVGP
jgi:long-chain acyl-CoA synthetase